MLRVAEQYVGTDTGRQRRANEDSMLARSPLFVVADGMGGAQAGEVASRLAIESFQDGLDDTTDAEAALAACAHGGERQHPRALPGERRARGYGHDAHRRVRGCRGGGDRTRGRQPRLLSARRGAAAPDRRSFARRRAHTPGQAHARGGRRASSALGHHTRAGPGAGGRDRHPLLSGSRRRRVSAVQRRSHDDGPRRAPR